MFDVTIEPIENDRTTKYHVQSHGSPITYSEAIKLLASDSAFRSYLSKLLADSPFTAFRWETPAVSSETANRPFEFVLVNSPGFCIRPTDSAMFDSHFTKDSADEGVVTFPNLRGDATLVVPTPRADENAYGHLAAFVRLAPESQVDSLWRVVGATLEQQISDRPIWLSTAGGGVAWLHVRLDVRPKYYSHLPYRRSW